MALSRKVEEKHSLKQAWAHIFRTRAISPSVEVHELLISLLRRPPQNWRSTSVLRWPSRPALLIRQIRKSQCSWGEDGNSKVPKRAFIQEIEMKPGRGQHGTQQAFDLVTGMGGCLFPHLGETF